MKKILITSVFMLVSIITFSQNYGKVDYMGKRILISSDFFVSLNSKYKEVFYDDRKQKDIYYELVDYLKLPGTIVTVDEAKRINTKGFPYCTDCKASNADKKRASRILYLALLPVIETYAR